MVRRTTVGKLGDRFRGALLGTAIGDALGAPVEGIKQVPSSFLEELDHRRNLTYTDDTAMTLGVGRSLVEKGGFDGDHMAHTLAAGFAAEPWRGYGAGPPIVFARLHQGTSWEQAANALFNGAGSYGNGAAMRVAPIALFAYPDPALAAHLASQSAIITHSHPEGIDGAAIQAAALTVVLAAQGTIDQRALIDAVQPYAKTTIFQEKLSYLGETIPVRTPNQMVEVLGCGIAAHSSVITALACFLTNSDSFPQAIKAAIGLGGDTDTIAAMTGALSGGHLGLGAIPARWQQVEGADELTSLADALLGFSKEEVCSHPPNR
jgi:poly(ADP-ribose) glycohydrolase ARH3